ncbi:MAG: hypothetical protein MUP81_01685 [Dehalococcoidia bacterium]|nr:hypothetical protein [Dehalococcoidia bacterium]
MNDMIEKLKDKNYVRALGQMRPEERGCLKKAGPKNCLVYSNDEQWRWKQALVFNDALTYAITPEYQPEPELMGLEIIKEDNRLGIFEDNTFIPIYCLLGWPNFEGFYLKGKDTEVDLENVARYMPNVVARFKT